MAQLTSDMPRNVSQGGCHLRVEDDLEVILAQWNVTLLQWEALAEDLGGVVWTTASPRGEGSVTKMSDHHGYPITVHTLEKAWPRAALTSCWSLFF